VQSTLFVTPARIGSFVSLALFSAAFVVLVAPGGGTEALADRARTPNAHVGPVGQERLVERAPSAQGAGVGAGASGATAASACPAGSVEVEGDYCPQLDQKCTKWMDPEGVFPRRCAEFAPSSECKVATVKKHFCIDQYEFPNKQGEKPAVMTSWNEAAAACGAQGKRLCKDSEWTLACEGQQHLPYPYGTKRDANACNIDKPHPDVNEKALASAATRDAEVQRLWQGEASGARAACVSPYGVFDMTGNVDEWVVNESAKPFKSGSKGGYWGPVRDRCRPMTTVHGEDFQFYQLGFRCCADAKS
jgi:hypothetical protein